MLRSFRIATLLLGVVLATGCGGSDDAPPDAYEASVIEVRNRVDSALADISEAQSRPELFNRMEVAGEAIARAAKDFDNEDAPEEFRQEHGELVNALQLLATDLGATASDLRNYPELLDGTSALQFEGWTKANRALRELADGGIEVRPIESR
jgi:hypothetical protein